MKTVIYIMAVIGLVLAGESLADKLDEMIKKEIPTYETPEKDLAITKCLGGCK